MKTKPFAPLKLKQICLTPENKQPKLKYNTIRNAHAIENKMSEFILNRHNPPMLYLHFKLSRKYIFHPNDYEVKKINLLLHGRKSHFVALFKDHMVYDYKAEFLRRKYNKSESHKRLTDFPEYYHKYLIYFCKPMFTHLRINRLIQKHYEKKAEYYYNNNCCDLNNDNKPDAMTTIFNAKIKHDISQKSMSCSNIFQTNFDSHNPKGQDLKNKFVESLNTCSLIIKSHHNNNKNLLTDHTNITSNDINYNHNGNESFARILNNIDFSMSQDNSLNLNTNTNKNTVTNTNTNINTVTNNNNYTDKSTKKFEPFSLRNQHIKLQSIVTNHTLHQQSTNTNYLQKSQKINKHLNLKTPTHETLQRIISQRSIHKKSQKEQQNFCLELKHNTNTIKTGGNRIVLPRTQSLNNVMKVSLVIYTNQNGRNKEKSINNQLSEYGVSSPTVNNVNINIHSKYNLSPHPTVSLQKKPFNINSIQENYPFSAKSSTLKNRKQIELLKMPQLNNLKGLDQSKEQMKNQRRVFGKNTRVKSEKDIFDSNNNVENLKIKIIDKKYGHLRFNSDSQCEKSPEKRNNINSLSKSKEKNKNSNSNNNNNSEAGSSNQTKNKLIFKMRTGAKS